MIFEKILILEPNSLYSMVDQNIICEMDKAGNIDVSLTTLLRKITYRILMIAKTDS